MNGKTPYFSLAVFALIASCVGIPPLNTSTISTTPASSSNINTVRKAVNACAGLPDAPKMFGRFEAAGFRPPNSPKVASTTELANGGTRVVVPVVAYDDDDVIVQAGDGYCFVGLRGMTPQQSYQLAQILVKEFNATTNAANGQGLSHHVVQAWQVQENGRAKVLIAAHKTWPWDQGRWPDVPGAAVTITTR